MVGRIGGQQKISIGRGCEHLHTIIHEIGEFKKEQEIIPHTKRWAVIGHDKLNNVVYDRISLIDSKLA